MGKGIDFAREGAPLHAAVLDDFKDQLLIVLLKRLAKLGDNLAFPVSEVDDTAQDLVAFSIVDRVFKFELRKKQ
jgi:hypothetical protein